MGLDKDDIKALIAILQKGLTDDDTDVIEETEVKHKTRPKVKKNTSSNKSTKKKFNNKFDNMPEMHLHKEDIEIDRKLNRFGPTPRRGAFKPLKVVCRVCGKSEMVDPTIIESPDRYKCNKCAIAAG